MAQIREVRFVDDLDGSTAVGTIGFGLDRKEYEIDLSDENAAKLRDVFAPFVAAARRTGGTATRTRRTTPRAVQQPKASLNGSQPAAQQPAAQQSPSRNGIAASQRDQNQAIRDWARKRGMKVADRGRIPAEVVDAFTREH